jgi:GT2 family glycosyltransferase
VLWRGLYHASARFPELAGQLPPAPDLYAELERFVQRAAGAEPGAEPDPSARVCELLSGAEAPETVRVLAYAQELIDRPELLATFWEALAGEAVTLVAYAPDADPAGVAGPLEAALADYEQVDVVLVAVASGDEERIAESMAVLLTHDASFAAVPAASDAPALRRLALGRDDDPPLVSIVIPVFNRADLTRQCLEALRDATPEPAYEVIVVDNGSTDGTGWFLRTQQAAGRIRTVSNQENRGFGAACNQGAAIARGEYLVLLNNDTVAQRGWLPPLVEAASDPSVGLAGSRLLYPDGRIQHAGIVWDGRGRLSHVHRFARADDPAVLVPRDFAAVTGACVGMRRATFFELGAFDGDYYMYVEDVDLCLRAWEAGLRVTYCPDSVLVHLENASVTDLAWRDENVRAGWQRLEQRWFGRWPAEVRRFAWPHRLAGSPPHPAALCFAAELAAHPELLSTWENDAKLVVFGTAEEIEEVAPRLERPNLDLVVVTAPAGVDPPPELVAAVTAQLSA